MAVGLLIEIPGGTQQQYDAVMERLGLARANATWPEGILCHIAGPMEGGWRVVDVWESPEAFDRFLEQQLEPAIRAVGVPPFQPRVFPVHRLHRQAAGRHPRPRQPRGAGGWIPRRNGAVSARPAPFPSRGA